MNDNNDNREKDFARKIAGHLNLGLTRIDDDKLARLRAGRERAMGAYREPVSILGLTTVNGQVLDARYWLKKPLLLLPLAAVVAGVIAWSQLSGDDVYDDVGEIDAKLLTGELPIDAFLDKDFASWVKESS